ncbi:hypothetical protein CCH79_00005144 [Gambusia affinis]|uniref:Uncharacterized protein n=1 Tax=Gambusia affinis TaxID=33528 RepID=A0A315VP22_GAMAF|nr:hypothetical protein CCH79_00005144 [Gambusia affinis]
MNCDKEDQRKSEDTLMEQRRRKEEDAAHGENTSIISSPHFVSYFSESPIKLKLILRQKRLDVLRVCYEYFM